MGSDLGHKSPSERIILPLAATGDVYTWGMGASGQLGLGDTHSHASPQLVWGLMRKGVRQIAAGDKHTAALTYNGNVYSWGHGYAGQVRLCYKPLNTCPTTDAQDALWLHC